MLTLESFEWREFNRKWEEGNYANQRYGQAFYNHFQLHKMSDQAQLKNLYEKDGEAAVNLIVSLFRFA